MGLIHTDAKTLTKIQGSSAGIQPKCYDNRYWYKKNVYGYEDQSEHLASLVLMILGIVNVAQGEMKPLPVIGGITIIK